MSIWSYEPSFMFPKLDPLFEDVDPFETFWSPMGYNRHLTRQKRVTRSRSTHSEVHSDKDKFQVTLHLPDFKLNEVSVKVMDMSLVVEAEHAERPEETVSRRIRRRYVLPRTADIDKIQSTLTDDGILIITAPKKPPQTETERSIPIEQLPSSQLSLTPHRQLQVQSTEPEGNVQIPVVHKKK